MTQINWQYQVNNRAGGYIVTATDWNDLAGNFRAFIDQTTGSGTTDNSALPIGIDLVNDRVYISDPDSTTPEDANHADTTLSVVGTTTLNGKVVMGSDDDITSFTGTTVGAVKIDNNQYDADDFTCLDFGYSGSANPIGRIGLKITGGGSSLNFGTSNSYSSGVTNTAMTISLDGKVGINNTAPDKLLQVTEGDSGVTPSASHHVVIESDDDMGMLIASGTTKNGYVRFGDSDSAASGGFNYDHNNNSLKIRTNGTDHMIINNSGQMGFRDDAAATTLGSRMVTFRTQTTTMTPFLCWRENDVDAVGATASIFMLGMNGDSTNPGTDDYFMLFRRGNGTTIGSVKGTGSASVNFATTSDQTLKNDLGDAGDVSAIIDGFNVHKFTWKDANDEVGEQIGLFAQEALAVEDMPYGIATPAKTKQEENDVGEMEDVYYPASIDYSKLVPLLIQEIKSLRSRVETLETS